MTPSKITAKRLIWRLAPTTYPPRRRRLLEFYGQFVNSGTLCFDIGACTGEVTDLFLTLGARVVAVEPCPSAYEVLAQRFFACEDVLVVTEAAGALPGTARLFECEAQELSSLDVKFIEHYRTHTDFCWDDGSDVTVTTLDDLVRRHGLPTFCKIDVEGYEPQVLKGLAKPIPGLSFEYHLSFLQNVVLCLAELERVGHYSYNFSVDERDGLNGHTWMNGAQLLKLLDSAPKNGNIYARLKT